MKNFSILIIFLCTISCKNLNGLEDKTQCPESYDCSTEIIYDKAIIPINDAIGKTYIKLDNSENSMVIKYIHKRKSSPRIMDDGYSETIFFQISRDIKNLELDNSELSDVKLYILKSCFCEDAGYEQILNGNLKLRKSNNRLIVNLEFEVQKDVQLKSLKTTIEL